MVRFARDVWYQAMQHFVCKLSSLGQLTGDLLSPLLGSGRFFQAAIRH